MHYHEGIGVFVRALVSRNPDDRGTLRKRRCYLLQVPKMAVHTEPDKLHPEVEIIILQTVS